MEEPGIHIFPSIEKLAEFFAGSISQSIAEISGNRLFYLALSGGTTPREIFRFLSENYREKIEWPKVMIFWGDERCVSPLSDESNYRMAYETLIKKIDIPAGNIFRIEAEKDPEKEAERYSTLVEDLLPHEMDLPRFDLILLGLGEDGHTASIFPGNIRLYNSEKLFEVSRHLATGQKRITATGRLINNARRVCFLVTGENKAEKVAQIIEKKPGWQDLPASMVNPLAGDLIWLLDDTAGRMLIKDHALRHR
jgi:6-phosphogluconolactonase